MYKNRHYQPRYPGAYRQGGFRIKKFDPSHVVQTAPVVSQEEKAYEPKHTFSDFAVSERLKVNIARHGFTKPTPIQDQAIPEILTNKDVVGVANTGTGKTAAFLIPLIDKIIRQQDQKVLIITPTRELALQIDQELRQLSGSLGVYSVVCIGGAPIRNQIFRLERRPQFVIGTPGRLLDLTKQRRLNLGNFRSVVLDEVDRMLDMGFVVDVQKIISQLPAARQSLFFSATLGGDVSQVMQQFTTNPITISVKVHDAAVNVKQEIVKINGKPKIELLKHLLDKQEFSKVLVFGRTKRGAEKLYRDLANMGFRVSTIHGNKTQNQRQRSLDCFKQGIVNILIATDVVARGIDVKDITHVVNYDLPETYENYLHRIGRTGRAGKIGTALTFVD